MRLLKNSSIKQRLILIIMAVSSVSVLLTTFSISIVGVFNLRSNIINELDISASIVGDRNSAALLFGDDKRAEENLSVFSVRQTIVQACLYTQDGNFFARYNNKDMHDINPCPTEIAYRTLIKGDRIELMRPILKNDERIGYIFLESTLTQVDEYIEKQVSLAILIITAGLLFSYLLAIRLQRSISVPILSLADTARQVSLNKNYSLRAEKIGNTENEFNNELVILTDSFNEMLSEIDARNAQLKKQYSELEKAKDAAENANRAKSQFLANISHELRTPLNAVIGFSSILMNQLFGPLGDNKYLEYAKDINDSGAHLLDIINDILDLSKAEAGKLILNYEEVHIGKAVNKCVTIITERAQKGKIFITTDIPKMIPPLVVDRLRFIQVIINILSNAVKFTNEGGKVHISVRSKEANGEVTEFAVIISDTGIGMSKEDIEHSFQSFGQVDSGLNRKYEGTGLGLPLTKKLMELHGGRIDIESELGKGTTVTLTFPAMPPGGMDFNLED
jgi:signal transduction histidine kinase